jgi:hypothetical protein
MINFGRCAQPSVRAVLFRRPVSALSDSSFEVREGVYTRTSSPVVTGQESKKPHRERPGQQTNDGSDRLSCDSGRWGGGFRAGARTGRRGETGSVDWTGTRECGGETGGRAYESSTMHRAALIPSPADLRYKRYKEENAGSMGSREARLGICLAKWERLHAQ